MKTATGAVGVAPTANAGPDASHNRFYGAAYTLAGSATGDAVITYGWTKVSGTPVPTFTDATNPLTTVTFDVAGAVVLRLTATNAFGSSTDDVTITVTSTGILDDFTTAPLAAYSSRRKVRAAYAGSAETIRKTTGGDTATTQAIGFASDNSYDSAARNAFVGAQSWAITTRHDQAAGARNVTNATGASQPIGGTTGTPKLINGAQAAEYVPDTHTLSRADAHGLTGAQSITYYVEFTADTVAAARYLFFHGSNAATALRAVQLLCNTTTSINVAIVGSNRIFTCPSLTSGAHKIVVAYASGSGIGTVRAWLDGTELVELSSLNPANVLNMENTLYRHGSFSGGSSVHDGFMGEMFIWNADFGSGGLAADLARALAL